MYIKFYFIILYTHLQSVEAQRNVNKTTWHKYKLFSLLKAFILHGAT